MGARPYWYIVPYGGDPQRALDLLREREFLAGRYNPVMSDIRFPITPKSPAPGCKHKSIDHALQRAKEEGTRSILDISRVGEQLGYGVAFPLPVDELNRLFGTPFPSRDEAIKDLPFLRKYRIERGEAIYFLIYDHDQPTEILFAGYSFD